MAYRMINHNSVYRWPSLCFSALGNKKLSHGAYIWQVSEIF